MPVYPPQISGLFRSALGRPKAVGANGVGTSANFVCGSFVRFRLHIDPSSKAVESVGFESNGCGYMLAAAEVIADKMSGVSLRDGVDSSALSAGVREAMGAVGPDRLVCVETCVDAFESALADFRAMQLEEFRGEKALVCTCFGVTEERIEELVASGSVGSLEDVARACNAGSGCGSCRMIIQEMLDASV